MRHDPRKQQRKSQVVNKEKGVPGVMLSSRHEHGPRLEPGRGRDSEAPFIQKIYLENKDQIDKWLTLFGHAKKMFTTLAKYLKEEPIMGI